MSGLHRVIHARCSQLGTKVWNREVGWHRTGCGVRATHRCAVHGDACNLHSRYSPVSTTRVCDTCRKPMVRIAPVRT